MLGAGAEVDGPAAEALPVAAPGSCLTPGSSLTPCSGLTPGPAPSPALGAACPKDARRPRFDGLSLTAAPRQAGSAWPPVLALPAAGCELGAGVGAGGAHGSHHHT